MSRRILVTGAGGFVGIHLVKALISKDSEVFGSVYGQGGGLAELLPADHIISGDLTDFNSAKSLIEKVQPDVVYHLAAISIVHDDGSQTGSTLCSNIMIPYNVFESVRQLTPRARIVSVCSANEYGLVADTDIPISEKVELKPLNAYGVSKVAQDMLSYQFHLAYGMDIVRLRPFNHTGIGQTEDFVIPSLARQFVEIKRGVQDPIIHIGNTASIRDFTDVSDMVNAYMLAAAKCKSGEVYNIGFGKGISILEIINLFEEISGLKVEVKENMHKVRSADVPVLIADTSKFRGLTGWEPQVSLKETLTRVYNEMVRKIN